MFLTENNNPYYFVSESFLKRASLKIKSRGMEYYQKILRKDLEIIRNDLLKHEGLEEGYYSLNLLDYYRTLYVIECLYEGLIEPAGHMLNEVDTANRDYMIDILRK